MARLSRRILLAAPAVLTASCAPLLARAQSGEARRLRLFNPHTGESFDDVFHDGAEMVPEASARLQRLLRDHHADAEAPIDSALYGILWRLQQRYRRARGHAPTINIHSAYRTAETNRALRSEGAALNSYHLSGRAVDISVQGYGIYMLANLSREIGQGGWGIYWRSRFVHVDTGPPRFWYRR